MQTKTKLTAEEFFELYPEESRLELIDGEVYEMPAPSILHQLVVLRIASKMLSWVEKRNIGLVVASPVDVVFSENIVLQPDVVYLSDISKVDIKIHTTPDLVVEVASPSTLKRDMTDKMKLYERYGVKEYWLVFPLEKAIFVYTLTEKGYGLFSYATEKGKIHSKVLEGFELNLENVFGGL